MWILIFFWAINGQPEFYEIRGFKTQEGCVETAKYIFRPFEKDGVHLGWLCRDQSK